MTYFKGKRRFALCKILYFLQRSILFYKHTSQNCTENNKLLGKDTKISDFIK